MRMAATAAVYNRLHNSSVGGGGGGAGSGGGGGGGMAHSQLARSLERILEEAHLSGELILANRKLKDFPKTGTKYNLADTVMADLSRNRFCELPEEITTFSFLETLLVYHNSIRSIPESVKHLTSLTYLDLRSNQLGALPREICFLPLQVLLVSNNRLTALPDELGRMERLTDLDASYNQLTTLPARIGELRSLRSFSLRSNQLMYLPRELTCLTLVSLDVSNNRIASLPLEIRQMTTLVEFNLENNPLTSPPASLCVRGLVHVFKFLETQAAKDEKGSRAGGNYDGYTTLRRAPRHSVNGSVLESNRVPRHHVDSGYSTCDGIDKRWSHDMPIVKTKVDSPVRRTPTTPPSSLSSDLMDASLTSSSSTIVDESISAAVVVAAAVVKPLSAEVLGSPAKRNEALLQQPPSTLHQHINYAHSSSSNGSSPDQDDLMVDQQHNQNGKADEKQNKNLGNIQTYREYKEALKQQRNMEVSNVYKMKGQKTLYDMSDASNALNSSGVTAVQEDLDAVRSNGANGAVHNVPIPKSIMKNGTNGLSVASGAVNGVNGGGDDCVVIPKKPIQKVTPSRNTELMLSQAASKALTEEMEKLTSHINGDCVGYVKPHSPLKMVNGSTVVRGAEGILTNNNKCTAIGALKSPVSSTNKLGTAKAHRTVTWNHDIPAEKLSFTMRREFDRQREETELMTQLRSIIETRLKMTLPEDIASALTDGVILCHLANYVRPRSVASIHVPSPGVSKLTMARCRRNVDNFLEACRRIGVDEELICSCADVVPPADDECNNSNSNSSHSTVNNNELINAQQEHKENRPKLPNPSAVLKTVSALIAMDFNPHHQNIRNLQQQYELQVKLQKHQQHQQQLQQQQNEYQRRCVADESNEEFAHEQQLIATRTKQQMQQQHGLDNSTFNLSAKCHFDVTVVTNGDRRNDNDHDDDLDADADNDVDCDSDDVVDAYVVADDNSMLQRQHRVKSVTNFFRHAKLKTFQKIKLNLLSSMPASGNGGSNGSGHLVTNNNHCTLQTIVETESEVIGGGGGGAYQLINEKPTLSDELQLKVETKSTDLGGIQYKLIDLAAAQKKEGSAKDDSLAIVSKRIEFFENSTATSSANSNVALIAPGGGASASAKPKAKNSIFSIYRVNDANDEKLTKNGPADKEAGSSFLLKHDSHVLTIILSCIFIVTFLLLVFFPLPG